MTINELNSKQFPAVSLSEHAGVRFLHLDSPWVQGSMRIKEPFKIELEYVQRMMAWLLFVPVAAVKGMQALQLGLGAAAITKSCYKALEMQTAAIEINPKVIAICHQHFHLPANNNRLNVVLADAAQEIKSSHWQSNVDALAVDLYDHEAAAPVLDSAAFYADCRAVLTEAGIMTVNLFGRNSSYKTSLDKIKLVFGTGCVWAFEPTREGNTVVLAFRTAPRVDPDVLWQRADTIESLWALPAKKWLKALQPFTESSS